MKKITLLLFMLVGAHAAWSQAPAVGEGALQTFFNSPDTVLPKLYEAAIAHSGEIERLDASKNIAAEDVKLAKKRLLSTLALTSGYSYGTVPYFNTGTTTTTTTGGTTGGGTGGGTTTPVDPPSSSFNPFAFGGRSQYSAGITASIPFDLVLTRNITIRRQELVMSQAVAQRKTQEMTIHQLVIQQYQALRLARTMLLNFQDALQSANINKKIADKRFKEGEIQVDEQMAALDLYSKALLAQDDARNRYQTAQLLLEDLIGTSINNIMLGK